ncbi:MAG: YceI family protein [Candidatus Cyclobacteriaceae bacterium M3_2C_046]
MRQFAYVIAFALVFQIASWQVVEAQDVTLNVTDQSEMFIEGTSTLHDWKSEVKEVKGMVVIPKSMLKKVKAGDKLAEVEVRMTVKSIESGRGGVMDKRTWGALKAEENPEVIFKLNEAEVAEVKDKHNFILKTAGDLTIAGVTKPIEMEISATKMDDGSYKFSGNKKFKMTEYEIDPPTAMFGQIETGDEVNIVFDIIAKS